MRLRPWDLSVGPRDEEAVAQWMLLTGADAKEVAEMVARETVPRWVGICSLAGIEPWNERQFDLTCDTLQELVDAAERLVNAEEERAAGGDRGSPSTETNDFGGCDDDEEDQGASELPGTCIQDLPNECLIEIMRRLGHRGFLPNSMAKDVSVEHPLQCALVCKRWRGLADSAVQTVHLFRVTENLARYLGERFKNLTALSFFSVTVDPLVMLANGTPRLEHLQLKPGCSSSIPAVEQALSRWTNLRHLDLCLHLCSRTPPEVDSTLHVISMLPSLRHLSFSYFDDRLPSVCAKVASMSRLTTLELTCSQLPPASPATHFHHILRSLVLRNTDGAHLPPSLGLFTCLESLRVEHAKDLATLPESLGQLSRLTMLEAVLCRKLVSLPNSLGQLSSLKVLQVEICSMQMWPETLGELPALQILRMNFVGDLPPALNLPTPLRALELGSLNCRLPRSLGPLPNLRKLRILHSLGIPNLPSSLAGLPNLEDLQLEECPSLVSLPPSLGTLSGLRHIHLSQCGDEMERLPEALSRLIGLESFTVSGLPRLHRLPDGIGRWEALTRLEVAWCTSLKALPEGVGEMGSLRELRLAYCSGLASLPRSLGKLGRGLQVLSLKACNGLCRLPDSVKSLEGLQVLQVWRCEGLEPLPEWVQKMGCLSKGECI